MKFDISAQHRRFYEENGFIVFDDLLTSKQLQEVNSMVDRLLVNRLKIREPELHKENGERLYWAGKDLWREDERLRKIECSPRFFEVALKLTGEKNLILAFDQLYASEPMTFGYTTDYKNLFTKPHTPKELASTQGLSCMLLLCLSAEENSEPSLKPGNGLYQAIYHPLDLNVLTSVRGKWLAIGYANTKAVYKLNPTDPQTHELKKIGYVFGDNLFEKGHPVMYG